MATLPDDEEKQPTTPVSRAVRAATAPATRLPVLLAAVGAVTALAPFPFASVGAAALILVTLEVARKR